jgi:hypothetical protein
VDNWALLNPRRAVSKRLVSMPTRAAVWKPLVMIWRAAKHVIPSRADGTPTLGGALTETRRAPATSALAPRRLLESTRGDRSATPRRANRRVDLEP